MAMVSHQVPMPYLDWDKENKQQAYHEWKEFMESFFVINRVGDDTKYHYILLSSGPKGRELFQSSKLSENDKKTPKRVWQVFEDFLIEKPNKWVQRIELQAMLQGKDESVESFILRLRTKTAKCSFRDEAVQKERIVEQLIKGCRYPEERKRLIEKGDALDMTTAVTILKSHEASTKHANEYLTAASDDRLAKVSVINKRKCSKCGLSHEAMKCPAFGTTCRICKRPNHWAQVCRSNPAENKTGKGSNYRNDTGYKKDTGYRKDTGYKPKTRNNHKKLHNLQADSDEELQFNIDALSTDKRSRDEIFTRIPITVPRKENIMRLRVKIDTGANANIITIRALKQIYPELFMSANPDLSNILSENTTSLSAYGGVQIQQIGCLETTCKGQSISFFVVEADSPNILGLEASRDLGLVKINCAITAKENRQEVSIDQLKDDYPGCFDTIGTFKEEFHITLKEDATPVIHPPRKCPIHIRDELFQVLRGMEKDGVIEKVNQPTDWVNSLAFSRKSNGKLRVCLDPKDLNRAIKREHHKTPTLEEISHKFAGAKVFSKLDAQHGYWAIKLDEASSLLTTFNSPFGRYKFLRLPFGLSVSQDVFQKRMDQILENCPGVEGISDDVCVTGKTQEEHDRNLTNLMEVAKQNGLVFNSQKCSIAKDSITFFGLRWTSDGVQPDQSKCDNIKNKASPESKSDLQSFLGMVQYLSPFVPNLSERTTAFRELLKKDSTWQWTESHEKRYQKLKNEIHCHLQLSYFDPSKPTTLEVDSSMNGLGAALLQDGKPVAFASKSLTDTEKRYANIEREMLAVVFACERFHTYIYGNNVTIESDHKPLETIQLKNISKAPPRLQRMMLRIQQYDVKIQYKPGKEMVFADFLSRNKPTDGAEIELDATVHTIMISKERKNELQEETLKDSVLSHLINVIRNGWPEKIDQIPKPLRPYWSMKDLLSINDGMILKGTAILIPKKLQNMILDKIHNSHQGQEKCLLVAKDNVFWLGMTKEIVQKVKACPTCNKYARSQTNEPLLQPKLPERPFEKLAADLFHLNGQEFLLMTDYYSKMPFVKTLTSTTSAAVINYMQSVFAIHGIPKTLITDNAKQFASTEFNDFTTEWDIEHITSSPYFPKSNGFIERMVQTVKSCLRKSKED